MTGHHEVTVFARSLDELLQNAPMPTNWKPFAAFPLHDGRLAVVCRRWIREENNAQTTQEEPGT
jgi:hypothetical protein